ncbi:ABC transporter permease [Nocardiopsis suaedae]|uniref:ABC transporter permease n=1 Tax=Nocardiopsis suaedae TaxID=3018444 RepID=A0ABT4TUU1_9ACTN|nr:ABC transporter permease [Nocardiopsis suaedae]MDA2807897.1 ABC transporter permease [Nocardiopsis suaedae]
MSERGTAPGGADGTVGAAPAPRGQLRTVAARFSRHRPAVASLAVLAALAAFAFAGPLLWQWDHTVSSDIPSSAEPSAAHPLGTTSAGNDVLGQLMRGMQQTLKVAFSVTVLATVLGSVWGAVAGYFRGWVDAVMMRLVDVLLIVPLLVVVAAVGGNVRGGTTWYGVALVIAAFSWTPISRVVRGVVLSLREQEFVEAARAAGASHARIILRHLLPNAAGPIIVAATLLIAVAILVEAAMSFLGFGIQAPDVSLGLMVQHAKTAAFTRPWLFYPPGLTIVLIALVINFIGDGLRDALDPRQTMVRR